MARFFLKFFTLKNSSVLGQYLREENEFFSRIFVAEIVWLKIDFYNAVFYLVAMVFEGRFGEG